MLKLGKKIRYLTLWKDLVKFWSKLLDLETIHHRNSHFSSRKGNNSQRQKIKHTEDWATQNAHGVWVLRMWGYGFFSQGMIWVTWGVILRDYLMAFWLSPEVSTWDPIISQRALARGLIMVEGWYWGWLPKPHVIISLSHIPFHYFNAFDVKKM